MPTKRKKIKLYMVEKSELPTLYRCFKTATTYIYSFFDWLLYIIYNKKEKGDILKKFNKKFTV